MEDDARLKVALQNENYITQMNITNSIRNEYNQVHVPALLKVNIKNFIQHIIQIKLYSKF